LYGDDGELVSAKIIVYAGEDDQYYSFITSEAYLALKKCIDFHESYGEKITGEFWLMCDLWKTTNIDQSKKIEDILKQIERKMAQIDKIVIVSNKRHEIIRKMRVQFNGIQRTLTKIDKSTTGEIKIYF
jgi:wyosine [tRNA(Phe)-imidazoG37] synthetase (radical SAM superfamily)